MDYGYKLTTNGRRVLAALGALEQPLKLTRVEVGDGMAPEGVNLADMHQLVHPVAEGAVGERRHENDRLHLTVQYSNQGKTGVKTFYLSEFIVYAADPETGQETDLIYGTMGDYRQPVPAYSPSMPASVWNFALAIVVSDEIEASISAQPGLVAWDEMGALINGLAAHYMNVAIPADGWVGEETDEYPYHRDIQVDTATEAMIPSLTIPEAGEAAAMACGLAPWVQTLNGAVRVFAASVPSKAIPASLALQGDASGFVLSKGGEGGTFDHRLLAQRDAADQHPISSITGLSGELGRIPGPAEPLTIADLEALLEAKTACLVITLNNSTEQRTDVNLIPFDLENADYSLACSGNIPHNAAQYVRLEPPPGYAFTGLAATWQPALRINTEYRAGTVDADGVISFELSPSDLGKPFDFVSMLEGVPARFILEVE